jgi:hypothetical protein
VGVALSPVPIIAVVLMLATPDGRVNGPALILGWILGLAAAGTIVLLAASGTEASSTSGPAEWVSIVMIVLGVVLMARATRQWQGPTRRCRGQLPASMKTIDTFTAPKARAWESFSRRSTQRTSSSSWAPLAVAQAGASSVTKQSGSAVFVPLGTLGPGIPVAIHFPDARPRHRDPREPARLEGAGEWHNHGGAMPDHPRRADRPSDQRTDDLTVAPDICTLPVLGESSRVR